MVINTDKLHVTHNQIGLILNKRIFNKENMVWLAAHFGKVCLSR